MISYAILWNNFKDHDYILIKNFFLVSAVLWVLIDYDNRWCMYPPSMYTAMGKMTRWRDYKMTRLRDDEIAILQDYKIIKWRDFEMRR